MAERLELSADSPEDLAEEVERAFAEDAGVVERPVTEAEVTVYKWSDGNPMRAMQIADSLGEQRGRILLRTKLVRNVYKAKLAVLDAWLAEYEAREEREVAHIDNLLDGYQCDFHADERTTRLSQVTLHRVRVTKPTRDWVSEDEALRYQETVAPHDVARRLNKTALLERLEAQPSGEYVDTQTGEVVSFVRNVPPEVPETFTVKQVAPGKEPEEDESDE